MTFKKFLAILLTLCLCAALFACGAKEGGESETPADEPGAANETTETNEPVEVPAESGTGANAAVFYLAEGEAYTTIHFDDGTRLTKPADPTAEGKYFAGWFTAEGEAFSDMKKYSGDQNFYAQWKTIYVFEAEKTQLTGLDLDRDDANTDGNKIGYGRSGEAPGKGMIADRSDASGGKYVRGIYYEDANLEFVITAAEDVDNVVLVARLAGEFKDYALTKNDLAFEVNGDEVAYSTTINLAEDGPFADFTISTEVHLNAGENLVRIVVLNGEKQFPDGTVYAAAPIVDCIKLYSTVELSMTEY